MIFLAMPTWANGLVWIVLIGGALLFVAFMLGAILRSWYRKIPQGSALIINRLKSNDLEVSFTGGIVWPVINKGELMDISVKVLEIARQGADGLICADNIRADIKVSFFVRVTPTEEDVREVAQSIGCSRASSPETLQELFEAKFSEALKTVGRKMEFVSLYAERDSFKDQIKEEIQASPLNGYSLEDAAIDYLEQTPKESLDPDNILDADGIRKITDITSRSAVQTNEFERDKQKEIRQKDVETREKILELDKQQADAEFKQQREINTIKAREEAETAKVQAEERLKSEKARIASVEEIAIAEENRLRQVAVAEKNKEKTIAVEGERVKQAQELEMTERERLVALKTIEKEKDIEVEKKKIAEVVRERVAVDKTVAAEQERIKDTIELAGAERQRNVEVINAEREAQESLIEITKAAEAREIAAKREYEEIVTRAEGQRVKAEKDAHSKKILAEGTIAEEAAHGLAQAKVKEAEAQVIELTGKAEAAAATEKHTASAYGIESAGMADVKVKEAHANAIELEGRAEATATSDKLKAEASGIEAMGAAEAIAIDQKADAMKKFDGVGREHEEFKIQLAMEERIKIAGIEVNRDVAQAQAEIVAEAMRSADIDIVGGDGDFLEKFFHSVSVAKSVDGFVNHSTVAQGVGGMLTGGAEEGASLVDQIKGLVEKVGLSSGDVKNLTISALLSKIALTAGNDAEVTGQVNSLRTAVQKFGLSDLMALWFAK